MQLPQLKALLEILMAAAAVDGHTDVQETTAIRKALDEVAKGDMSIRTELESHQWAFELENFKLEASIKALGKVTPAERRFIIALLEGVEEADGVIDLAEAEFIRRVATALGATPDEVAHLTVEIIDQQPPPVPQP